METVGQYTGFKDKSGKKIYEGDILHESDFECDFEVVWDEDCGFWAADIIGSGTREMLNEYIEMASIIGNIWNNPELLEEEHEN